MKYSNKIFFILLFTFMQSLYSQKTLCEEVQVKLLESNNTQSLIQIEIDSVRFIKNMNDESIEVIPEIKGATLMNIPNKPLVPCITFILALPPSASISTDYKLLQSEIIENLTIKIASKYNDTDQPEQEDDLRFCESDDFPADILISTQDGYIRDQRILKLTISLLHYNSDKKSVRINKKIRIKVQHTTNQAVIQNPESETIKSAFERTIKSSILNYEQGLKWRSKPAAMKKKVETASYVRSENSYKIIIKEDGIYRIYYSDLDSIGLNPFQIDPRTIQIFNSGTQIPITVSGEKDGRFDEHDYIEFRGTFNRGNGKYLPDYSPENVYWLQYGVENGIRMSAIDAGLYNTSISQTVSRSKHSFHMERDEYFDRLLLINDSSKDHWFWSVLNANQSAEYHFETLNPVNSEDYASIKITLHGSTHTSFYPDHHILIYLNDRLIEDSYFDGQIEYVTQIPVPNNYFNNGDNILKIVLPGDSDAGEIDQIFFNWFEVSYFRELTAKNDYIEITNESETGIVHYSVSGFSTSDIDIIDGKGRRLANFDIKGKNDNISLSFQDKQVNLPVTYYIYISAQTKRVAKLYKNTSSDLVASENSADYIIITHKDFIETSKRLANHREQEGLKSYIVDVEDIYDEFNYGLMDPSAIKDFISHAYYNWSPPHPLYILLMGDTHWGYDKTVSNNYATKCYVPTKMEFTVSWGICSSDNYFVCVSGDDKLPDLFIGRLPVSSNVEANILVDKIINYEQEPLLGEWRNNVCVASGSGDYFEESMHYLKKTYISDSYMTQMLSTNPESEYFGTTQDLVKIFNNGVALLNFIGHGGGGVFFDAELFLLEDVKLLNNPQKLPAVFSLTCFIGYFDNPSIPSLGEELLRAKDKGIVAHFGSAGRAWVTGDYFLNNGLFSSIFESNNRSLGQITTMAKWYMMDWSRSYKDHLDSYNLLGDPALELAIPHETIQLNISENVLSADDTLLITGTAGNIRNGTVIIEFLDSNDSLYFRNSYPVVNNLFEMSWILPTNIESGNFACRAYAWDQMDDACGSVEFFVNIPAIYDIHTIPEAPVHLDSIYIAATLRAPAELHFDEPDSLYCYWSINSLNWSKTRMSPLNTIQYITNEPVLLEEGVEFAYYIQLKFYDSSTGILNDVISDTNYTQILRRSDLTFGDNGIYITGENSATFNIHITNQGDVPSQNAVASIAVMENAQTCEIIKQNVKIPDLAGQCDTTFHVSWLNCEPGTHSIKIILDDQNFIDESNEMNNEWMGDLNILLNSGDEVTQFFGMDSMVTFRLPGNPVSANSSFKIQGRKNKDFVEEINYLKHLDQITLQNPDIKLISLKFDNPSAELTSPFEIQLDLLNQNIAHQNRFSPDSLSLFYWVNDENVWYKSDMTIDTMDQCLNAQIKYHSTLFCFMNINDYDPPKISIRVDDQNFINGDYISSTPLIQFVIEDSSGISMGNNMFSLKLDSGDIDSSDLNIGFAAYSQRQLLISFRPLLMPGNHDLVIQASDYNNNRIRNEYSFYVSSDFRLQSIANHPNPFIHETIIAYTLSAEADQITIKIYTVSGRLIRSFKFYNEINYVEHVWDGTDEDGVPVANGVYYLKFTAKRGSDRIETIEKMAKLK